MHRLIKPYNMTENKTIWVTVADYAKYANVTEKTVYNWIDSGKIPKDKTRKVLSTTLVVKQGY